MDSLNACVWVQCIDPPSPPAETDLVSTWDGEPGTTARATLTTLLSCAVEFHDNATYTCASEDLFFEWEREMVGYNVTCQEDGGWAGPETWPVCVPCQSLSL